MANTPEGDQARARAAKSPDNLRLHEVFHVDDEADGSSASGAVTITATYASTGAFACASTYKIKYTRQ